MNAKPTHDLTLRLEGMKQPVPWAEAGIALPTYDIAAVHKATREHPVWVHFGIGNIFRIFLGGLCDTLLTQGDTDLGINCVETHDLEIVDRIYTPCDNLVLAVTLHSSGEKDLRILAPLAEAVKATGPEADRKRLEIIAASPSLQMISLTITEKGYALRDLDGHLLKTAAHDMQAGPGASIGAVGVLSDMLHARYLHGARPLALVSMDNVSRNGEKLRHAVLETVHAWQARGLVPEGFVKWVSDESKVSFPWTMIDKITPRPSPDVAFYLSSLGVRDMDILVTDQHTYIAPFANAEAPQYLVIEDSFPNGRPPLEKAGVYMTDRETVNLCERMKVTACLNPLHTGLCTYACMLGYDLFADAMQDRHLLRLAECIGYDEDLPMVEDPGILSPKAFLDEVIHVRFPNRYLGDTSQRIATDISQMVGIRFGETIRRYVTSRGTASLLIGIPLAIAGWLRYLLALDDMGTPMELAPDPMLPLLQDALRTVVFGDPSSVRSQLRPILQNTQLFGMDLYEAGIGEKIEHLFRSEIQGPGAVRKTLAEALQQP